MHDQIYSVDVGSMVAMCIGVNSEGQDCAYSVWSCVLYS